MRLNDLKPADGSTRERKRVGRGLGAGQGKTAGRGHKGQHSRSGGFHKIGFEGGQMPLQRRLPHVGFSSPMQASRAELRLDALDKLDGDTVDLASLIAAGLVPPGAERVKIILAGTVERAFTVKGAEVVPTRGARAAIEKAGGKVEVSGAKAAPAAGKKKASAKKASTKKTSSKKTSTKKADDKSESASEDESKD